MIPLEQNRCEKSSSQSFRGVPWANELEQPSSAGQDTVRERGSMRGDLPEIQGPGSQRTGYRVLLEPTPLHSFPGQFHNLVQQTEVSASSMIPQRRKKGA